MSERPIIKLQLSPLDKLLEMAGYIALILLWLLTLYAYFNLPEKIPTHFNFAMQADNYGGKISVIILPLVATLVFVLITFLNKFPQVFNYAVPITKENAETQYRLGTRMLRLLKLAIIINFFLINLFTYLTAIGKANGLGVLLVPFMIGVLVVPIIFFIIKSMKAK